MGKKRASSSSEQSSEEEVSTLETGHVIFFYRIKVDTQGEASDLGDVQRLLLLLIPKDGKGVNRLLLVPKKHLPNSHQPVWAFVEEADADIHKIDKDLAEYHYSTKTKGERTIQGARICGEGLYSLILHQKPKVSKKAKGKSKKGKEPQETGGTDSHVHFAFVLELPHEPGTVQHDFHIEKEGNFLISVKNPHSGNPPSAGLPAKDKADFPAELQEKFDGKKWVPVNPPSFLDVKGAELLLMAVGKHITDDLGQEGEELVEIAEQEEHYGINGCKVSPEQIFKTLKMNKEEQKEHPTQALTTGEFS